MYVMPFLHVQVKEFDKVPEHVALVCKFDFERMETAVTWCFLHKIRYLTVHDSSIKEVRDYSVNRDRKHLKIQLRNNGRLELERAAQSNKTAKGISEFLGNEPKLLLIAHKQFELDGFQPWHLHLVPI